MAKDTKKSEKIPSVKIGKIIENKQISGSVTNLAPDSYSDYKIIVYVHTDQWYIHPYEEPEEGYSWASIKKNGTWKISTIQREFKADSVAALLVKRTDLYPVTIDSLEKTGHNAIIIKELIDTPDYGKV